ncbi:MAG: pentapeptide repeat-containing protein [Acinetobacter sp.]|nr:pentapeptide repeat-containing protein [Acinetobacter sp.]
MTQHEIKNRWTGEVLFTCEVPEGMESGMIARHAVEAAIANGADLRGANLRGANLRGANLRGADLEDADLRGAKNAPMIITGLRWPVHISGTGIMRIGCQEHSIERWKGFSDELISRMDGDALEFWNQHKVMLLGNCDLYKHAEEAEKQEA